METKTTGKLGLLKSLLLTRQALWNFAKYKSWRIVKALKIKRPMVRIDYFVSLAIYHKASLFKSLLDLKLYSEYNPEAFKSKYTVFHYRRMILAISNRLNPRLEMEEIHNEWQRQNKLGFRRA
jgi:hypothetical protein